MNIFNLLGGLFSVDDSKLGNFKWLGPIVNFLDSLIVPITIILAVAGAIWVIILGVQLAKAESADKASEAKKRLINVAVAIVAIIVFVWLLTWFASAIASGQIFGSNPIETPSASGGSSVILPFLF